MLPWVWIGWVLLKRIALRLVGRGPELLPLDRLSVIIYIYIYTRTSTRDASEGLHFASSIRFHTEKGFDWVAVRPFVSPDCRGLCEDCVLVIGIETHFWF
jgi:hypothetical protein